MGKVKGKRTPEEKMETGKGRGQERQRDTGRGRENGKGERKGKGKRIWERRKGKGMGKGEARNSYQQLIQDCTAFLANMYLYNNINN